MSFSIARIAAAVVEVEMRVEHDVDVLGTQAVSPQAIVEKRAVQPIDVAEFRGHLLARARFDQDPLPARMNQQAIHRKRDPVARVRLHFLFPHGARDHAEHRAAVEQKLPGGNNVEFEVAELHAPPLDRISLTAA